MRLVAIVLVVLLSAGCGALGVGSTGPNEWWLVGTTPDDRQLLVATQFGGVASGCTRWEGWDVEHASDQVRVEAMVWRQLAPSGCTDEAVRRTRVIDLDEPLDGRQLVGCQHEPCDAGQAWPDGLGGPSPAVVAAGDNVVVAGQQTAGFSGDGDLVWRRDDVPANRLHASDGVVVVSDGGRSTVALAADSGETLWQQAGSPRVAAEGLVLQCTDNAERLRALDVRTGTLRWSAEVACGPVAMGSDSVVMVTPDRDVDGGLRLVVVDAQTGQVRLDRPLDDGVDDRVGAYDGVLVADGRIIVGGAQGDLVVLEPDGTEVLRLPQVRGTPIAALGDVVVVVDHRGATGVDVADGHALWERADLTATDLETTGDILLGVDGPAAQLERIDPRDGTAQWSADVGVTTDIDAAMLDDTLHVATALAHLRIDPASGRLESWTPLPRATASDSRDSS